MERSLVERARAGDRDAFEAIVRLKVDAVLRTANAMLGDPSDAQEAMQDAFVSAWRGLPSLKDPDRFEAWFGRILQNSCRMTLRRRRSSLRELAMPVDIPERPASFEPPDEPVIEADHFDRAFERLSPEQRWLLVAHHLDETPLADLAYSLGIPVGTAKSRLFAARGALERALAEES